MSITFDLASIAEMPDGSRVCSQFDTEAAVNMSNMNAFRVMRKLGIEADYCGTLAPEKCAAMLPQAAEALVAELTQPSGDDYDRDDFRIMAVLRLMKLAISRDCLVSWS